MSDSLLSKMSFESSRRRVLGAAVLGAAVLLVAFACITTISAQSPKAADPSSIVDYLKAQQKPSEFNDRATLFAARFTGEKYVGSAAQNVKLLEKLLNE